MRPFERLVKRYGAAAAFFAAATPMPDDIIFIHWALQNIIQKVFAATLAGNLFLATLSYSFPIMSDIVH